jgi:CHASE3 domain sensor protein
LLQGVGFRGFLFTGNERFAQEMQTGQANFRQTFETLRSRVLNQKVKQIGSSANRVDEFST